MGQQGTCFPPTSVYCLEKGEISLTQSMPGFACDFSVSPELLLPCPQAQALLYHRILIWSCHAQGCSDFTGGS